MNNKELKLMAGEIVKKSEYSISAKKQLLNYILNEASDAQIKALILDGQVELLEEDAINIVNKRFDISLSKSEEQSRKEFDTFIETAKKELCNIINEQNNNIELHEDIIDFIVNKASDYQVLSMFFEETLPEEISNPEKEILFNEMIQDIIENKKIK